MSWKNEKTKHVYYVEKERESKFYAIVRDYTPMGDITREELGKCIKYTLHIKGKNCAKFYRDIQIMKIFGLSIDHKELI